MLFIGDLPGVISYPSVKSSRVTSTLTCQAAYEPRCPLFDDPKGPQRQQTGFSARFWCHVMQDGALSHLIVCLPERLLPNLFSTWDIYKCGRILRNRPPCATALPLLLYVFYDTEYSLWVETTVFPAKKYGMQFSRISPCYVSSYLFQLFVSCNATFWAKLMHDEIKPGLRNRS